jgi:ABC-2 type transport system permease protein
MSVFVAFRKEWLELIRSHRLLIVAVVLAFFGLTSPLAAKFIPDIISLTLGAELSKIIPTPTVLDAIAQYVKNMGQFGIILALLLTMGAIVQEKDKGTIAMILVKPLSRGAFLSAKFLGLAVMFAISLAIAGIGCYYYTMLLFEAMDFVHWLVLNLLLFLYVLVPVAITLFWSTVTKSQVAAAGIALGMIAIGGLLGTLTRLGKYLPGELVTWGTRLMQGDSTNSWTAFGISLGLIVVPLLAAWLIFKRQEL